MPQVQRKPRDDRSAAPAPARLPKAYREDDRSSGPPGEAHFVALDYAEPSPIMLFFQRWSRRISRTARAALIVGIIGFYPAMMIVSSAVDDSPIRFPPTQTWAVSGVGVAIEKIAREVSGPGWAADRPGWHPQARLTALPAWQDATAAALAQHVGLLGSLTAVDGERDPDLIVAANLLAPEGEEAASQVRPRLAAAAAALNRYDTRASGGYAVMPSKRDSLREEAGMFAAWAADDRARLSDRINADQDDWPASVPDIEAFYAAKARAHFARELIVAARDAAPGISLDATLSIAVTRAEAAWSRAAEMKPLMVSNQSGADAFLPNHLATMAYYLLEAEEASRALHDAVAAYRDPGEPEVSAAAGPDASPVP